MKITGTASITRERSAILTDDPWTLAKSEDLKSKKRIRVTDGDRIVEIEIKSVQAALKNDHLQYLAFLVPPFTDQEIRKFILHREVELV